MNMNEHHRSASALFLIQPQVTVPCTISANPRYTQSLLGQIASSIARVSQRAIRNDYL
jgi:hypothetical protein